jgi:signal transduction histidine kinase
LLLGLAAPARAEDPRVLVIHSYRPGYEWTDLLTQGLTRALDNSEFEVWTDVEFMDSARRLGEEAEFEARLRRRYANVRLDAIVAFDDAAAAFLAARHDLFPGVPVVFGGVSDRALIERMPARFCGVEETFDLKGTLDTALRLHPGAQSVYLIVGETPFAKALSAVFQKLEPDYPAIRFVRLNGEQIGREALYEQLRKTPAGDVVFLVSFQRDHQGRLSRKPMMEAVAAASAGPVWAMAGPEMGHGLFAGRTNGGAAHGRKTGELLLRVLRGEKPEDVGTVTDRDAPLVFDRDQLERRGVSVAQLPAGAVIWDPNPSLWARYRMRIVAGACFLALETALIAALVRSNLRRRAEDALTKSNAELAAALRAAREAGEAKGRFLANMSHEIRTPMNGIVGSAELLADGPLTADQRESVETIRTSAVALLTLLNDLLDLSRMEAGQLTFEKVPFAPAALIEEVARMMAPQAKREQLYLRTHAGEGLPAEALGDPMRIRQVLLNLAGNALKFTREGGVDLFVSADRREEEFLLRFEVRDTGPGIADGDRKAVFLRFRQLEAPQARHYGGAGLGLAIAKELVTAMGGEIGVESELGKGCRFWFTIPAKAPAGRAAGVTSGGAVQVG